MNRFFMGGGSVCVHNITAGSGISCFTTTSGRNIQLHQSLLHGLRTSARWEPEAPMFLEEQRVPRQQPFPCCSRLLRILSFFR